MPGRWCMVSMARLMSNLHLHSTSEESARHAAELIGTLSERKVQSAGRFTIALSGGSTPRLLYRVLASPQYEQRIAWESWHLFWGDERCVPPHHRDSNYRMAMESLLDHVPLPEAQIHRIRGEDGHQVAAAEYEDLIRRFFLPSDPVFDLVLLGMGEDGHTASLFPGVGNQHKWDRLGPEKIINMKSCVGAP